MSNYTLSVTLDFPRQIAILANMAAIIKNEGGQAIDARPLYEFLDLIDDGLRMSPGADFPPITGPIIYSPADNIDWVNIAEVCSSIAALIMLHLDMRKGEI